MEEGAAFKPTDFAPAEWGWSQGECDVLIVGYRLFAPVPQIQSVSRKVFSLINCVAFVHFGTARIFRSTVALDDWHEEFRPTLGGTHETVKGSFLVLLQRLPREASMDDHFLAEAELETSVGLVQAMLGEGAAFDRHFSYVAHADGSESAVDVFSVPQRAGLETSSFNDLAAVVASVQASDESKRLHRALRLFKLGLDRTASDAHAYVNLWTAVEVLAPQGTNNLDGVKRGLASAYGIPVKM